jgi:hypothetical protein
VQHLLHNVTYQAVGSQQAQTLPVHVPPLLIVDPIRVGEDAGYVLSSSNFGSVRLAKQATNLLDTIGRCLARQATAVTHVGQECVPHRMRVTSQCPLFRPRGK